MRDIFEYVEPAEFETITDMHKAVGAAMREGTSGSTTQRV